MGEQELTRKYPLPDGFVWVVQKQNQLTGVVKPRAAAGAATFQIWLHRELNNPTPKAKWVVRSYDRARGETIVNTHDEAINLMHVRFLLGEY